MATMKDFIPMAEALAEVGRCKYIDELTFKRCVDAVAKSFARGNDRFKSEQFRNAAGYYNRAETAEGN